MVINQAKHHMQLFLQGGVQIYLKIINKKLQKSFSKAIYFNWETLATLKGIQDSLFFLLWDTLENVKPSKRSSNSFSNLPIGIKIGCNLIPFKKSSRKSGENRAFGECWKLLP